MKVRQAKGATEHCGTAHERKDLDTTIDLYILSTQYPCTLEFLNISLGRRIVELQIYVLLLIAEKTDSSHGFGCVEDKHIDNSDAIPQYPVQGCPPHDRG